MYTRLLRFLVRIERHMSGHCDGGGSGSGSGHCY